MRQPLEYKYVVVGDMGVGKSSLINRFVDDHFSLQQPATMGLDLASMYTRIGEDTIKLLIQSTLGHRSQTSIFKLCARSAMGVVLVYDVTSRKTFESLPYWMESTVRRNEVVVTLVGNRTDLEHKREVSTEEGKDFANKYGFFFVETSAKTGENVSQAFLENATEILLKPKIEAMLKQQKKAFEVEPKIPKKPKKEIKKERSRRSQSIWSKVLVYFP